MVKKGFDYLIKYTGELGSIFDIDKLFHKFTSVVDIPFHEGEIKIDLSDIKFVSPLGALSLLLLLDKLDKSFFIKVTPPPERVVSYMERMNFLEHCTKEVYKCFEKHCDLESLEKRNRYNKSNVLLEITSINEDKDVETVDESTRQILTSHGMKSSEANKIASIISEFVANILDHSKGNGYTAIQYYPSLNKVQLAIGDNGIGFVNSLKPTLLETNKGKRFTNLKVIQSAFESRISSSSDIERGIGLNHVRSLSFEKIKGTSFFLKTHKAIYQVLDQDIVIRKRGEYFPGTYISLELIF
ncbi:hypothetical protein [Siminovitchia fordii]|uniref:Uncharacterized protein n=1 Tax=Siminovitchia fordii TaxID=254759 RepID=A0ABQ4KCD3_9BACI|nr:hypothetical protein [Siminovitchia fordii]GIN23394.1 hypothetical protein J1TS3_45280 [Siminovitchia fordii]